ncbi:hypothetical protein TNCT_738861, partial [Trichonephila clavata]
RTSESWARCGVYCVVCSPGLLRYVNDNREMIGCGLIIDQEEHLSGLRDLLATRICEFKDQLTKLEQLNDSRVPTAALAPKPKKLRKTKRATGSPRGRQGKSNVRSSRSPHPLPLFPKEKLQLWKKRFDDGSEIQITQKDATSTAVPGVSEAADKATILLI